MWVGAAHPTILERSRLEPNAKYRTLPPSTYTLSGRRPTPATGTTQSTSILSERRGRFVAGDAGRVGHRTAPRDRCLPGQRANMQVATSNNNAAIVVKEMGIVKQELLNMRSQMSQQAHLRGSM